MSSKTNLDQAELLDFGEALGKLLAKAEDNLKTLGRLDEQEELDAGDVEMRQAFEEMSHIDQQIPAFAKQLADWNVEGLAVHQKSELDWLETRMARLNVVTRNSLRIGRRVLELPDPERDQEEMQLMINTLNINDEPFT